MATDLYSRFNKPRLVWLGYPLFIFLFTGFIGLQFALAESFPLVTNTKKVSIIYDSGECKLDSIAANLLADDKAGKRLSALSINRHGSRKRIVIVIGSIKSKFILQLNKSFLNSELKDKWECYSFSLLDHPTRNISRALVIAGSDFRGTAYGVFEISSRIGVTPWYWWADVTPKPHKELYVKKHKYCLIRALS